MVTSLDALLQEVGRLLPSSRAHADRDRLAALPVELHVRPGRAASRPLLERGAAEPVRWVVPRLSCRGCRAAPSAGTRCDVHGTATP